MGNNPSKPPSGDVSAAAGSPNVTGPGHERKVTQQSSINSLTGTTKAAAADPSASKETATGHSATQSHASSPATPIRSTYGSSRAHFRPTGPRKCEGSRTSSQGYPGSRSLQSCSGSECKARYEARHHYVRHCASQLLQYFPSPTSTENAAPHWRCNSDTRLPACGPRRFAYRRFSSGQICG